MSPLRHTFRIILGVGLALLGILGLILPVMPGWIFLIPGLLILGDYFPPVKRLVDWAKLRFAEAEQQYRKQRGAGGGTPMKPEDSANAGSGGDAMEEEQVASKASHPQQ